MQVSFVVSFNMDGEADNYIASVYEYEPRNTLPLVVKNIKEEDVCDLYELLTDRDPYEAMY